MDCRQTEALLALWVGHDLADGEPARSIQTHLETCDRCRERSRQFVVAHTALLESRLATPPGASVWPRVRSRLAELERQPHFAKFNVWVPTAIAAAACSLMVLVAAVEVQRKFDERSVPAPVVSKVRAEPHRRPPIEYVRNRPPVFAPDRLPHHSPPREPRFTTVEHPPFSEFSE
jgi:predicted anti-sigma-YlaC factor YlaD